MKKFLLIPIFFLAFTAQAQRPKLDTLASGKIMLTYYVEYVIGEGGNKTIVVQPVTVETFKPGNKRYVVIDGKRVNVFRREAKESDKGHYEFAKF